MSFQYNAEFLSLNTEHKGYKSMITNFVPSHKYVLHNLHTSAFYSVIQRMGLNG